MTRGASLLRKMRSTAKMAAALVTFGGGVKEASRSPLKAKRSILSQMSSSAAVSPAGLKSQS